MTAEELLEIKRLGCFSVFRFQRAALPLLAVLLAASPARADAGDEVVSFLDRFAATVKTHVEALPDKVAALPGQLGLRRATPLETKPNAIAVEAPAPNAMAGMPLTASLADTLTPKVSIPVKDVAFQADLSQFNPAVPNAIVAAALPEPRVERGPRRFFCAEYARIRSGFPVFGDAKYWWERARDLFDRVAEPVTESVMVFSASKRLKFGHVAVVTHIVSPREIRVDQANWMNKGEIDHSTPVRDVSPNNDWSMVRVWDVPSKQFGARTYKISGFIVRPLERQASR